MNHLTQDMIHRMKLICDVENIPVPTVMRDNRRRYGCYYPRKQTIHLGKYNISEEAVRRVLTHELAHHLDGQRRAKDAEAQVRATLGEPKQVREWRKRRDNHGLRFFGCLEECIDHMYGDRRAYDWDHEYKQIRKWAIMKGYCSMKTAADKVKDIFERMQLTIAAVDAKLTVAAERGQA